MKKLKLIWSYLKTDKILILLYLLILRMKTEEKIPANILKEN